LSVLGWHQSQPCVNVVVPPPPPLPPLLPPPPPLPPLLPPPLLLFSALTAAKGEGTQSKAASFSSSPCFLHI
jgi:hypothetical protein